MMEKIVGLVVSGLYTVWLVLLCYPIHKTFYSNKEQDQWHLKIFLLKLQVFSKIRNTNIFDTFFHFHTNIRMLSYVKYYEIIVNNKFH